MCVLFYVACEKVVNSTRQYKCGTCFMLVKWIIIQVYRWGINGRIKEVDGLKLYQYRCLFIVFDDIFRMIVCKYLLIMYLYDPYGIIYKYYLLLACLLPIWINDWYFFSFRNTSMYHRLFTILRSIKFCEPVRLFLLQNNSFKISITDF